MNIEFFFFEGCPHCNNALEVLAQALELLKIHDPVERIMVVDQADAITKRFLGSPSIRINGVDLEYGDESGMTYQFACRRYREGELVLGYPPRELVVAALRRAMR